DAAFPRRAADRLLHMDEMDQEQLDGYLSARGRSRRTLLCASRFMGVLAAVGPWFGKLAHAADMPTIPPDRQGKDKQGKKTADEGKVHVVESSEKTVHLGVFDANLPPVETIESGDLISYP